MLPSGDDYETLYDEFEWSIPEAYNMGVAVCDDHVGEGLALVYENSLTGDRGEFTFEDVKRRSDAVGAALLDRFSPGDRVAVMLPQRPEAVVTHVAALKAGLITVPLSPLFGPDGVAHRLGDADVRMVVVDNGTAETVREAAPDVDALELVVNAGDPADDEMAFATLEDEGDPEGFEPADTHRDDPAMIVYTSGTTGPPKGALHAHRKLPGRIPGFQLAQNFTPQPGDRFWTPADWAWVGGLLDSVFAPLSMGVPVVAFARRGFEPEEAYRVLAEHDVRNSFLPPTALKMMRQVDDPGYDVDLRAVHSGGESLPEEVLEWTERELGVTLNEMYGQTEATFLVGNCHELMAVKPGSMGRPYPGHDVDVIDEDGERLPAGEVGEIAVTRDDPVVMLEYWENPEATEEKFDGEWLRTGDLARKDEDGYLWFKGRADDVIISSGYRIGPGEIEDHLIAQEGVADVAVVGSPDETRGEIVKAFVLPAEDRDPDGEFAERLRAAVKEELAAYEYPREIEFVEELPRSVTGKIQRSVLQERENE